MPEKASESALYEITGCEIFATGKWNGDEYTEKDLDAMVEAFDHVGYKPPVKLGHSEKQKILKDSGLPAAGWIQKIYRNGKKLLADIADIPQKVYDLIEKKAYDRVSAEIYWDFADTVNKKKWPRVLKAIALLGAEVPEVTTLKSISAMYDSEGREYHVALTAGMDGKPKMVVGRLKGKDTTTVATLIFPKSSFTEAEAVAWAKGHDFKAGKVDETEDSFRLRQGDPGDFQEGSFRTISPGEHTKEKEEVEKMEMEERLEESEKKLEEVQKQHEQFSKTAIEQKTVFEKQIADLTMKLENEKQARRIEQVDAKVAQFMKDARISPAQAPLLKAIYLSAPVEITAVFSKDGKDEERKFSPDDLVAEFVSLQPQFISGEKTKLGLPPDDIDGHIRAYCKEHSLDYSGDGYVKAISALAREKKLKEV
ncbi:MAG: hypothetical protein QME32_00270 [Endomicrobiia bacterium]|nr:hypothetical protein [Endomicrobiia bacterium]